MRRFLYCISCCLFFIGLQAQVCTGSLGDAVVNINFGNGLNPGPALSASLPNLTYTTSLCPDDGYYTIVNNTAGCFGDSWLSLISDHTPNDPSGYMLLINASFNSGDFYVQTVSGLCGNTTYEFAAWILNILRISSCMNNGTKPNLTFTIESTIGTVLGKYQTGDIPQSSGPVWKQYGLFFKTPAQAEAVVLRITNAAPGGCGNDLAIDDITFRPCGASANIFANGSQPATIDKCVGDAGNIIFNATIAQGYILPAYQWQSSTDGANSWTDIPGATSLLYTRPATGAGVFQYRLSIAEKDNIGNKVCRTNSNEITVNIHALPGGTVTSNSPLCELQTIELKASDGKTFSWTGPNGFASSEPNPTLPALQKASGTYFVTIQDEFGCTNKMQTNVVVSTNPVATVSNGKTICQGEQTTLNASGGSSFKWSPASSLSSATAASPIASPAITTVYSVVVYNANCTDTAQVTIAVSQKPAADAGPDRTIFEGGSTTLAGSSKGTDISYRWTPAQFINNTTSLTPIVSPTTDFTYTLQVLSNVGCGTDEDEVFVRVYRKLTIPNAFSPNGDGINDTWRINNLSTYPDAELSVFDRYGKPVFQSLGYKKDWDGTRNGNPLPEAVYYYILDLHVGEPIKGSVVVIR